MKIKATFELIIESGDKLLNANVIAHVSARTYGMLVHNSELSPYAPGQSVEIKINPSDNEMFLIEVR